MAGLLGKSRVKFVLVDQQVDALRPLIEEVEGLDGWVIFAQLVVFRNAFTEQIKCEAEVGLVTPEMWEKLVDVLGKDEAA